MVKKVKELIKIVGKGNLLEDLFIFLGSFQHADLDHHVDHRNHVGLSKFIRKTEEPLDRYFNLKFSLQRLYLIYVQAYKILSKNNNLNAKDVIDEIHKIIKGSKLSKDINEVVDGRKLDLLNVLANPKREPIFKTEEDFEDEVLTSVRKLLNEENAHTTTNKYDRELALNKCIISSYYSVHKDIKVDKDVVLLFSIGDHYEELSPSNRIVKREVLELNENLLISQYIRYLARALHKIKLSSRDGTIKYTIDHENVDQQEEALKEVGLELYPINTKSTLEQLLKNQSSDEFEKRVTDLRNIYYSPPQGENERVLGSNSKQRDHKNTVCKLILGVFALSVGLYVADYFFMEQKLFNPIKIQDSFANLVIAAVLTIIIVYALFQLLKSPPHSAVNEIVNEKLEQPHAKRD